LGNIEIIFTWFNFKFKLNNKLDRTVLKLAY